MADIKIMIVEDELITVELIRGVLEGRGYLVIGAADSGQKALDLIGHERPDLILMDITIKGDIDGIELARIVSERHRIPVIYLTAFADRKTVERAKVTESYGYIIKPFGETELLTNIEIALYKHRFDLRLKESEERYRTLFETMKDAVYMRTLDGEILDINPAMVDMLGYSREEWASMNVQQIYADSGVRAAFQRELEKNGYARDFEIELRRKDGSTLDTLVTATLIPANDGKKHIVRGIIRDITDRKRAEEALKKSFNEINDLYNNAPCGYHSLDPDGVFVKINDTELQWLGYSREDLVGKIKFADLQTGASAEKFRTEYARFMETGSVRNMEFEVIRKDGTIVPIVLSSTSIKDPGGTYVMSRTTLFDITERKRIEEALRESELRYRAIFEGSMNMVYLFNMKGVFIDANDAALEFLGYSREELYSMSFKDMVSPEEAKKGFAQTREAIVSGGQSRIVEFNLKTRSGDNRCVETTASPLYREGKPYAVIGVARDVTERKKFIEELKSVHDENMYILNSITSLLIGVSTTDVITHWNHMAEQTFGIPADKALGEKITGYDIEWNWADIYSGISSCIIEKCAVNLSDIKFKDKNGREGLLGITINPITGDNDTLRGFLIYGKDITARRMAEQQLLQSSKLATVGEMATGVAHELNQPLNIIKMASQFLLDGLNDNYATVEFIRERTEKIIAQVDRAAHIINHLREFGRKSDYDFGMIDPNQPIRVAFDMLGEQLRLHSIVADLKLDDTIPSIKGDLHKLEQVFINMIVNAKDAFEGMKNPLQENKVMVTSFRDERRNVIMIEFNDNGPGIPDEIRDRIFEPFFTTKEVGKGTGLGLSISYGIIKAHHGTIEVISNPRGTTFTITLPVDGRPRELQ